MMLYDGLRPPPFFDPQAAAYKDWLHLILLDHASGNIGSINVSLHGAPSDPRSRAVGTALVHVPGLGWVGNMESVGINQAAIGRASIGLEHVGLAIDHPSGTLMASVHDPDNHLVAQVTARFSAAPIVAEQETRLGQGWIAWWAMPRLAVSGSWTVGQTQSNLSAASAYHDHNWGRWYWGDDFGWEWGCFLTSAAPPSVSDQAASNAPSIAVVFTLTTDRGHRKFGLPTLHVYVGSRRHTFRGSAVKWGYAGTLDGIERRLPGALAALHNDRVHIRLPRLLNLSANNGHDCINLEFAGRSAAQLITGDPIARGYSFIHEIAGDFAFTGRLGDMAVSGTGLGVFEYVC